MSASVDNTLTVYFNTVNRNDIKDYYISEAPVPFTETRSIGNSIFTIYRILNLVFCTICRINLFKDGVIKHLKEKHLTLFKQYREANIIAEIKEILRGITEVDFNTLTRTIGNNRYYFRELNIDFNGYKCSECDYTNTSYKQVRKHYNNKHPTLIKLSTISPTAKATYIIDNIPL